MVSSRPRAPSWQSIFRILALLSHLVSRTRARTQRVVKPKPGPVQRSGACRLSSFVAFRTRARRATRVAPRGHEPSAIRSRSQKLLARTAADSTIAAAAVELFRRLVPHMLPPCGCCRRAWRSAVLQGSADLILPRILLASTPTTRNANVTGPSGPSATKARSPESS